MVAKLAGTTLPCLPVRDGFCQGLILHVMPSDHPYSCTCLGHDSIPSKAMVEILEHKVFYVLKVCRVYHLRHSNLDIAPMALQYLVIANKIVVLQILRKCEVSVSLNIYSMPLNDKFI